MRRLIPVVVVAIALVSCTGAPPRSFTSGGGSGVVWQTSLDAGLAQARTEGKPVVVTFGAGW